MITRKEFSLRRLSLPSAVWYFSIGLGWPLIGYSIWRLVSTPSIGLVPAFLMVATMIVVLELLPLVQGRGHDPQGVVMSTAFTSAMLFLWGLWPAVVMISIASVASDVRARKQFWKVAFNPAQYALSVAAAYLVVPANGVSAELSRPLAEFNSADLWWMAQAAVVYFAVNLGLVAAILAWSAPFSDIVRNDFWHYTTVTFSVLALSPLIVILAQEAWQLIPLLLIPLLLIYYTAQMSLEREHAAGHDALTQLPNRVTLAHELDDAFLAYARGGDPFALMLIDLDDFKAVNDTLGHQAGDELLVEIASRLQAGLRPGDLIARLGGDEFAVLACVDGEDEARAVAQATRAGVGTTVRVETMSVAVELSLGVALCPEHATDAAELLRRADVAMYHAKAQRSGIEVYAADYDDNTASRLGLLGELRHALEADELELHYQPKVAPGGRCLGVEALIRWRHPERGYIPPDQFIPVAERSDIMPAITARMIDLALTQAAEWRAQGMVVPIAVNISPTDLVGNGLPELLARGLAEHRLPAEMLQLEITERVVTNHLEAAQRTLHRLRAMGISISLDDFGTGYSSLWRLSSFPVDEIKIDRMFIAEMSQGSRAYGIVGTLIGLAHALGVPAIAEGVETAQQSWMLARLNCDGMQGWHVAYPMSHQDATEWLRRHVGVAPVVALAERVADLPADALETPIPLSWFAEPVG